MIGVTTVSANDRMQQISEAQDRLNRAIELGSISRLEAESLMEDIRGLRNTAASVHQGVTQDQFEDRLSEFRKKLKAQTENDDVSVDRKARLEAEIQRRFKAGSLTEDEVTNLKASLNKASTVDEMRELQGMIREAVNNASFDEIRCKANFEARIVKGLADGSLSASEAEDLRKQIAAAPWSSTDPKLLAQTRTRLDHLIYKTRHNSVGVFDNKASAVQKLIDQLPAAKRPDFQRQLDRLSKDEHDDTRLGALNSLSNLVSSRLIFDKLPTRV